ncbi:expression library immunization antigen 1 [Arthroderma uncinatum]|uniref:expression library immunization antigen 1 n=1 Tax=Arthroderma uncinatum TaxID=74035 RepID=UPI00144A84AF|nr:expression library immunization antigen 1 [Arthroderma uncinatum]KAF3490734.1 expression library immunization antigen 1 [Arthroderma uncinatum]
MAVAMVFQNIPATPLFTLNWTPRSSGAYAGTCIFLIVLGAIARILAAAKSIMDRRFLAAAKARRYVVVAGKTSDTNKGSELELQPTSDDSSEQTTGKLISAKGVEENVRVVNAAGGPPVMPWRFSVDLPRAAMLTLNAGVGYLLMLAVMTMNVGYFLCVLVGIFVGDLGPEPRDKELLTILPLLLPLASAHFNVEAPPTRGGNEDTQPSFPCGGPTQPSSSRTKISLDDPKVAIAMEMGHDQAAVQVLLGVGSNPGSNFNITVLPTFRQIGLGAFCLPEVKLTEEVLGFKPKEGMDATLQVLSNGDPTGGLYHCVDITFSSSAKYSKPDSCKNGTGIEAFPFQGDAARRNANESTPNGQQQPGRGGSGAGGSPTQTPTPSGNMAPIQTAAWGVLGAAIVGGVALL